MSLTKEQKKQIIEGLKEKIDKQKSMVFVNIAKLKAKDLLEFRNELKEQDCLLFVAKKTLLKIASEDKKLSFNPRELEGETAVVFGFKDEVAAAKISNKFSFKNEHLKILGGVFEKEFIDTEKVVALAKIPSRQELLAKFVGTIKAPISGFANVLQGNIKGLLYVLSNIKS